MLEAVVFDFDGVLVDSEPLHYQAFVLIGRSLGIEMTFEQYVAEYIGFDDRDAFRVMLETAGQDASPARVAELCAAKQPAFDTITQAAAQSGGIGLPGAVELVDAVKASGLKMAIASGATRADIDLMLGLLDRRDVFEIIVTADDVERSKPDPASYSLAVEKLGVEPGHCVAIEDTLAGLMSAAAAGLRTVGVATTHPADTLAADNVVEGMQQLSVDQLRAWFG